MIELIVYAAALGIAAAVLMWVLYMIVGDLAGAPFVPVSGMVMKDILKNINPRKGSEFWDLGSGNGKVIFAAVKDYGVKGRGVDINPYLVLYCNLKRKFQHLENTFFYRNNFYKTDLSGADYVYFYLFNGTVEKVSEKLERECKKGTIVISRAFEIQRWKKKLVKMLTSSGWKTYVYKV